MGRRWREGIQSTHGGKIMRGFGQAIEPTSVVDHDGECQQFGSRDDGGYSTHGGWGLSQCGGSTLPTPSHSLFPLVPWVAHSPKPIPTSSWARPIGGLSGIGELASDYLSPAGGFWLSISFCYEYPKVWNYLSFWNLKNAVQNILQISIRLISFKYEAYPTKKKYLIHLL